MPVRCGSCRKSKKSLDPDVVFVVVGADTSCRLTAGGVCRTFPTVGDASDVAAAELGPDGWEVQEVAV